MVDVEYIDDILISDHGENNKIQFSLKRWQGFYKNECRMMYECTSI